MQINPMLLIDFYKAVHPMLYPPGIKRLVSYLTPRVSRLPNQDTLILFGLQAFIKEYLIEGFNRDFFCRSKAVVIDEYRRIMDNTLGKGAYDISKIEALHDLGYLPLEIRALPEGSRVNIHVPMIEVTNTHPDFAWLVNTIESAMSAYLWHAMVSANVGATYREIVNRYYNLTVEDSFPRSKALGDFSMRGQESIESAIKSSAAFCLSFVNTATVGAVPWLEKYYHCNCETEQVAYGAISTEHSVMCSNFAVDGDEVSFIRRLLTEVYPHHSFSMVSDSYDYWNLVDEVLPQLKEEILAHDGTLLIRGDSGDPVEIVTKTVFKLWEIFGGTVNSKGYKVLDPHVKAIYGDSITQRRCEQIYEVLMENGFACNNVSLGVGSFSMQCLETDAGLQPYTRDTFGIAVKTTYAEDENGKPIFIFKNPKTDSGSFKKSQRGCCAVFENKTKNGYTFTQELTLEQSRSVPNNQLQTVFKDGKMVTAYTLRWIRDRLWNGSF